MFFADDVSVSKGMVKYVSALPRESVVDVEGLVNCPDRPIDGCTIKDCELSATSIKCVSRRAADRASGAASRPVLQPLECYDWVRRR